jgi:DNA-binding transcriptional ArsR family regulator
VTPQSDTTLPSDSATFTLQQRMLKALSHPIRMRALMILNERVASPSEIAEELDESLGVVAYHMRTLEQLECIELVRRAQRRGAVEHYYRAVTRPWIPDEQQAEMPVSLRRSLSASVFSQLVEDVSAASQAEGLDRPDSCMIRFPLVLDEEGWTELSGLLQTVLDRAVALAGEVQNRRVARGGDNGVIPAILGMQMFERRVPEHDRQDTAATRKPKAGVDLDLGKPSSKPRASRKRPG